MLSTPITTIHLTTTEIIRLMKMEREEWANHRHLPSGKTLMRGGRRMGKWIQTPSRSCQPLLTTRKESKIKMETKIDRILDCFNCEWWRSARGTWASWTPWRHSVCWTWSRRKTAQRPTSLRLCSCTSSDRKRGGNKIREKTKWTRLCSTSTTTSTTSATSQRDIKSKVFSWLMTSARPYLK